MNVGHRNFAHKKPEQLVYLELGGGNGGMLLSISDEGFRFRAVSPVRANGVVPFAFSLDGNQRLEGGGVIEWVEEDGKSGGLRFTEVSPEFRAALADWMFSDFSHNSPRREATSTVAAPPDSMEKIRQELRSGYPQRPSESHSQSRIPDRKRAPGAPDRTAKSIIPEAESESEEPQTAKRLFPLPLSSWPDNFKPASAASAFLKPSPEVKSQPASPAGAIFVPPAAPSVPVARIPPVKADVSPQPRPHIPPIEESFEHAWERAKLTAPPDSTHLSRAAAGGIIAIALAVILGALAYNFRQDIGAIFIRMGQSISGDNHTAATARAPETKMDSPPSDEQNATQKSAQPAAASPDTVDSENAAKPATGSPNENAPIAAGSNTTGTKPGSTSPDGTANSGSPTVSSNGNPADAAVSQPPISAAAKTGAPADTGTGQEEFNSAREILRGSSRERELPRAVDLLWAGVKKGYVPAEVTLADLFRRGDGVEKNCDQARVLLVAAAKKGSLDARQMLELMAERGCE